MSGMYQPMIGQMQGYYGQGANNAFGDYSSIMKGYQDMLNSPGGALGGSGGGFGVPADQFKSYAGYEDFAKTGGVGKDDVANMRARAMSPVRAAYGNAEREMGRQRALQGGYSPNFMAASAKMAREQGQSMSDAQQNTNAGLADFVRQGKMFGLQGMTPIEQARMQMAMQSAASQAGAAQSNSQNDINNRFRALAGMQGLYGTTPGQAQLFGNQALSGMGAYGSYLNNSMGQQTGNAQLPGNWQNTMGMIGDIGNIASGVLYPW